jgi:hypothetical protein
MRLQSTVACEVAVAPLTHQTVWCAPDSPVNYSGAPLEFPEGSEFSVEYPGAPDTVRCATRACSDFYAHCSALNAVAVDRCARSSCCSAGTPDSPVWHQTLSGASPDSPVNYSGAPSDFPEGSEFSFECPGAPDTVRCARPGCLWVVFCSLCLTPFLVFLLAYCEPLAPVELMD